MVMRPNFLGTVLLEVGVTWAHLKAMKKAGHSVEETAIALIPAMYEGIQSLRNKFGDQREAMEALESVHRLIQLANQKTQGTTEAPLESTFTPNAIQIQLQMSNSNVHVFNSDAFALGYFFGMAEMEYYHKGGSLEDQKKSLHFIRSAFHQISEGDNASLIERGIRLQGTEPFGTGRQLGSDEVGQFFKSQGAKKPLGLMSHLQQ